MVERWLGFRVHGVGEKFYRDMRGDALCGVGGRDYWERREICFGLDLEDASDIFEL